MKRTKHWLPWIVAGTWFLGFLIPFSVIGEWWGAVWYPWNLPLASLLKSAFWPGKMPLYFLLVTLANATVMFWAVRMVVSLLPTRNDNHENPDS